MRHYTKHFGRLGAVLVLLWPGCVAGRAGQAPQVVQSNLTFTVMAANLTGQSQKYGSPQIRILQGLKPDVVALQEFNYGNNSPGDIRAFVDAAFGTNFAYYRESNASEIYDIPNGVVSRYPIIAAGTWDDVTIPNRGFAWARIQLPGTNELYVVSVHLKASSGYSSQRATEATNLKDLIEANIPSNAWVIVAGDLNTGSRGEGTLGIFKTFLSDSPIPSDAASGGNEFTNLGRDKPYDYVLPSFTMTNAQVPVVVGGQTFTKGLVFDSRVFTPLGAVPPVEENDATNCQHMAVLKAFRVSLTVTNWVTVPSPRLALSRTRTIRWFSASNLVFCVQASTNLSRAGTWTNLGFTTSSTTNYSFPATNSGAGRWFYRVRCP